jgi:hypothetical protein
MRHVIKSNACQLCQDWLMLRVAVAMVGKQRPMKWRCRLPHKAVEVIRLQSWLHY